MSGHNQEGRPTTTDTAHIKGCVWPCRESDDTDKTVCLQEPHRPLLERVDGIVAGALGCELNVREREKRREDKRSAKSMTDLLKVLVLFSGQRRRAGEEERRNFAESSPAAPQEARCPHLPEERKEGDIRRRANSAAGTRDER